MENLSLVCGGLGIIEEDDDGNQIGYSTGEYCLDNLKDLLRFLRRDDPETREVFKQVCKWNIVGKDILPLIQHCQSDTTLVLNAVKVLVFLTMPIEPTSKDIPQQIEYLWGLKSLITSSHAIPVIITLFENPLEHLQGDLFTEDDWKLVQLVVTLFHNILAVQDVSMQQRVAGSASEFILIRDRFLELLFEENVMDLILVLTQHVGGSCGIFRQDNLLLLETFYYIYKGQVPELIARAHLDASTKVEGDAEATAIDLKSLMEEEKAKRRQTILFNVGSRSQFSGSFTRLTMGGSKVLVKGNPCSDSHDTLLKGHKNQHGSSKKMLWDSGRMPTTNKNILWLLHDFTNQFLSGGYNVLMQSIREDIEKERHAIETSDVVSFFQVAEFVMSFQHHKLLSSKIHMLDLVLKMSTEDSKEPQTARVLLYKLFYDQTDLGMTYFLFNLIKSFNAHRQPKSDLADLVETIHIVIRLMENLQARGSLRVAKKARKKRKKKASTANKDAHDADQDTVPQGHFVSGGEQTGSVSMLVKEMSRGSNVDENGDEDIVHGESDQPDVTKLETQGTEPECNVQQMENSKCGNSNDDYASDVSSADEQLDAKNEVDFKVSSLVSSLANNTIIQNLCWLLKFYKSNSIRTNHYIICALRRICEDMELSPMLYQLSLLNIFHAILEEQKSTPCKEYENIVLFLTSLVRRMLRKIKSYPLLFVEVLFWKTRKECHYINCESMLQDLGKMRDKHRKQGDDAQHGNLGEVGTFGRNGWVRKSIGDALGDDEADVVVPDWRDDDQSEENPDDVGIQKTLKRRNLDVEGEIESINEGTNTVEEFNNKYPIQHKHERVRKRLKPLVVDDAMEEKLKDLYEKYKDCPDLSHRIVAELNLEVSPAQISKKLKQMGFKFPSKRRMAGMDVSNIHVKDTEAALEQPPFIRKRVGAFSEEKEMKIKTLFEQFKDHKKCSHMIASALDGHGTFTAAQISRKLRQLGLRLRKPKSGDNVYLKDEDGNDFPTEDTAESDGETLLSLKKRSKKKQNLVPTEETPDQNNDKLLDDFDDILLSSAFRSNTSSQTRTAGSQADLLNPNGEVEAKVNKAGTGEQEDAMMSENPDTMQDYQVTDDLADEVADFGNNASQKASGSRRKLRMVIDPDDED
ncbi:protein timeless homolog isoform X2 [Cynara cardunculus var. scolymus]|uniref:protein timeless homolog isoform X2 n=1 Tax=Cynara cardunculus var. scolymus TaxID=59895 RepID=UPI000D630296|nr:protein timeless homolog isoform X2 [Cynara cardunculus var. scolymus]